MRDNTLKRLQKQAIEYGENGQLVLLTYENDPASIKEAAGDVRKFVGKVRRRAKKQGVKEFRVRTFTERERNGRIHSYILMHGGVDKETLSGLWGKGLVNIRPIWLLNGNEEDQ